MYFCFGVLSFIIGGYLISQYLRYSRSSGVKLKAYCLMCYLLGLLKRYLCALHRFIDGMVDIVVGCELFDTWNYPFFPLVLSTQKLSFITCFLVLIFWRIKTKDTTFSLFSVLTVVLFTFSYMIIKCFFPTVF